MHLTDLFLTEDEHTVYNWTAPIVLYRGSQRGNPDAFNDTRLGYPTFSDVPGIAHGYTVPWRRGDPDATGKVFSYKVKLNRPCILWEGDVSEVIMEPGTLQQRLKFSDAEMVKIVQSQHVGFDWYCNDVPGSKLTPEQIVQVLHTPYSDIETPIMINGYALAASPVIQKQAVSMGYDGFVLRGPYTGEMDDNDIDVSQSHSWDGITALEWMIFKPSCVSLIGEVVKK